MEGCDACDRALEALTGAAVWDLVDPALEYDTFVHVVGELMRFHSPSIRRDSRLLAVGTKKGVVLLDLARMQTATRPRRRFLPCGRFKSIFARWPARSKHLNAIELTVPSFVAVIDQMLVVLARRGCWSY